MWDNDLLYGYNRNERFLQIWGNDDEFLLDYHNKNPEFKNGIPAIIDDTSLRTLFYLLAARYGSSTIASDTIDQFKLKVFSTIFMYGPTWEKRLEYQEKIRALSDEELRLGGKAVYNTALNPSNAVGVDTEGLSGTNTLTELQYINQQNTTNYKKSLPEAYSILLSLLETDVTAEFLDKFKKLFKTVVTPEIPMWYITDRTDTEV